MKAAQLFEISGRIALVTGASSGLGKQFARSLAENGAKVVLVARRADRLRALSDEIQSAGGHATAIEADVLDQHAMTRAFDEAERVFGTVDIVVNNAGVTHVDFAVDLSQDNWRRVIATDLDSVFLWAQEAGKRLMAAEKRGSIINVASILGIGASKTLVAYAAAKAGVIQMTKALALEWATRGVRVNAIAPGYFVTEMNEDNLSSERGRDLMRAIPVGHFGGPNDLDGALLLLASDAGRFITGTTIVVDGGHVIRLAG